MSDKSSFKRLAHLAVTVCLNLSLVACVAGSLVRQEHQIIVESPYFLSIAAVNGAGWVVCFETLVASPWLCSYEQRPDRSSPWTVPADEGVIEFPGGFLVADDGLFLTAVKHGHVLLLASLLQAIHHRRLIARLVRRR